MVIVTQWGGLLPIIKGNLARHKPLRSLYKYNLRLITSRSLSKGNTYENVSHVSVVVESNSDIPSGGERMQLSYCGQDCNRIPTALQKMYGPKVKYLDLSYNSIETLKGLEQFNRLEELILDNNKLGDNVTFPHLPHLRTLSLNNNQITDLEVLINKVNEHFPSLSYLSLLSNKACPNQLSDLDKDESDYQRYRYFVIYKLPLLRFLDSRRVSASEQREAATRGEFMRVRRPPDEVVDDLNRSQLSQTQSRRPLPVDFAALGKHKGAYGKIHYKYTGKHSEGNRFIVNNDL
ncbi:leucine-rich melanocyte differentiation-associated protein-like isoform X2 [Galleria mellonella]|nr:leucine-rich melanocyte differentiation-associated protein-like isoform X2 [Galleria mellonella]XP_052749191.1 leucine-rich melanocyte differentiation-associated protein-like isoform X2 [Galleria mellonella]